MKLLTIYQISAINSAEKNATKNILDGRKDGRKDGWTEGRTDRGEAVYPPPVERGHNYKVLKG